MEEWKQIVLARYCGEYPPAKPKEPAIRKSSEDIAFDLSGMGDFSADEVSLWMASSGYSIAFTDDAKPVWLLLPPTVENALNQ